MIDGQWLEKVATAADVYCSIEGVDEQQIDEFITYLFRIYGYSELLNRRKENK